jgi:hypothetical protein
MTPTADDALHCLTCTHPRWAHWGWVWRCLTDGCGCDRFVFPLRTHGDPRDRTGETP